MCLSDHPSKPPTDPELPCRLPAIEGLPHLSVSIHPSPALTPCPPLQPRFLQGTASKLSDFPYIQVTRLPSHLSPCFLPRVSPCLSTHPYWPLHTPLSCLLCV